MNKLVYIANACLPIEKAHFNLLDMRKVRVRDRLYFLREYIINSQSLNLNNVLQKKFIDAIIKRSLKLAENPEGVFF